MSKLLTVQQAIQILDATPVFPRAIRTSLAESSGLRLASDIRSDRDYPPFDRSLMDGYAVRSGDIAAVPVELTVTATIAAGAPRPAPLPPNAAAAIMTGAPMPAGADCVVPVEHTTKLEDGEAMGEAMGAAMGAAITGGRVRIERASSPGRFIARRGSDASAGKVVLATGSKLSPAAVAVAASVGAHEVDVFARPRAIVLSTGDEIVPLSVTPGPTQIRNSNSAMLVALLNRLDCDATAGAIVPDDLARTRDAIGAAIEQSDVVFVTGGMSMGEFDFVPRVLAQIGVELKITKLRIKPGKPFVFGVRPDAADRAGARFVFGLPGNPVSAFACTIRLSRRLLSRLAGGDARDAECWIRGSLLEPLEANGPREFYQPAILRDDGQIAPLAWKGSADIYTLAKANALLVRPENDPPQPAGAIVRALLIP